MSYLLAQSAQLVCCQSDHIEMWYTLLVLGGWVGSLDCGPRHHRRGHSRSPEPDLWLAGLRERHLSEAKIPACQGNRYWHTLPRDFSSKNSFASHSGIKDVSYL